MSLSIFILGLWVFLQSYVVLGWGTVDAKLIGFVGMAFVVCLIVEALFVVYRGTPLLPVRAFRRTTAE